MSKLDHHIYVPAQLAEKFSTDRSYEECMFDAGFNWYLFLVEGVNDPRILWVNSETANVYLMGIDTTADEIEDYIIEEIESHLTDRPFEHVTLRNNKRHIKWHQYVDCPPHVKTQVARVEKVIKQHTEPFEALLAVAKLNDKVIPLHEMTMSPSDALTGLLDHLADQYSNYLKTTNFFTRCMN